MHQDKIVHFTFITIIYYFDYDYVILLYIECLSDIVDLLLNRGGFQARPSPSTSRTSTKQNMEAIQRCMTLREGIESDIFPSLPLNKFLSIRIMSQSSISTELYHQMQDMSSIT